MFSSVAPMIAPPFSAPRENHTARITARPMAAPVNNAICGVLREPWVIDIAAG